MQTLRMPLVLLGLLGLVPLASAACDGSGGGTGGNAGSDGSGGSGGNAGSGGSGGSGGDLQPGDCREDADCTENGSYCSFPGAPFCGGAGCPGTECGADADCQAMDPAGVCEMESCCGLMLCKTACSADSPCPEGQTCGADGHCAPQSCANEACPINFDCGSGADPSCARRACSSDTDCDGYCVLGLCYESAGMCDFPKP